MATMTFQINDKSTETTAFPVLWGEISENANGTVTFSVRVEGSYVGDLRGLFFDVADESLIRSLTIANASPSLTRFIQGNDTVVNLGNGSTMSGLAGSDGGFDAGLEIGTSGIGKDDIQQFRFTLGASRALTLNDFANIDIGARLTSVGEIGTSRSLSSKLLETTFRPIDAIADYAVNSENGALAGNVLDNDRAALSTSDVVAVTGWSGGALGVSIALNDAAGARLQLNADGSYRLDTSAADALSEGESLSYALTYEAKNVSSATSWALDSGVLTVTVTGKNDGPEAVDDVAAAEEDGALGTANVLANDNDVDRLDSRSFNTWNDSAVNGRSVAIDNGAGATITLNADGGYVLDASAADALSEGEQITQVFSYTMSDNHGATSSAALTVTVSGVNDGPVALDDNAGRVKEDAKLQGSVLVNDSDIDRLDTLEVASVNGQALENGIAVVQLDSGALVTIGADGTFTYDTNGAFNSLNDGQAESDGFEYTVSDGHGGTATARVNVAIDGVGSTVAPEITPNPVTPPGSGPLPEDTPVHYEGLSHGYWKNHESDWELSNSLSFEQLFGINQDTWEVKSGGDIVIKGDITLAEALALKDGQTAPGAYALAREAVAAVLNSLDEDITYRFRVNEIKEMVQDAYAGGDIIGTKDLLEYNNTLHEWDGSAHTSDAIVLIGLSGTEQISGS